MRTKGGAERVADEAPDAGIALHKALPAAQGPASRDRQSRLDVRQEPKTVQARTAGIRELRVKRRKERIRKKKQQKNPTTHTSSTVHRAIPYLVI